MKLNKSDFSRVESAKFGVKSNIYKSNFFTEPVITKEGFLLVDTILARKVVMPYHYKDENGVVVVQHELMGDAIFNPATLASAEGLPFVLEHPQDAQGNFIDIRPENFKEFLKGILTNPRIVTFEMEDLVIGTLKVFDPGVIQLILDKKLKEVSQGYFSNTQKQKGVYNNVSYEAEQTDIIFNHLALVSEGRAGDTVRLLYNKKPDKEILAFIQNSKLGITMKTKINDPKKNTSDKPEDEKLDLNAELPAEEDEDKQNIPPLDPGQAPNDPMAFMMSLVMKLIESMNGGSAAPAAAPVNAGFPGQEPDKEQLIGNAKQAIEALFAKNKIPANLTNNGNFLTTNTARDMIAENIHEYEKAIINAKSIIGAEAPTEALKYNSLVDFKKAMLIEAGKDETEVKAMNTLTVNAHFDAVTDLKKNSILNPQGSENSNTPNGVEFVYA